MERKNYLYENLTDDEKKYVRGIIWKSARKCRRDNYQRNKVESTSIFDEKLDQRIFMVEDKYDFLDRILDSQYAKTELELRPYTDAEQRNIVQALDNLARESGLYVYIKQLTFKEKLVVFLLYVKGYRVNEVALLLNISRKTVSYREDCVKEKIKKMKGLIKDGR